jgi:hypothetical protein
MEKQELIRINSLLNPDDDNLPFAYYSPQSDGKVTWHCGHDQNNKITSVFCYDGDGHKDKRPSYLNNVKEALNIRLQLIEAGWLKITPPEVTVKYADGTNKPLNRDQKRFLASKVKKLNKENPFEDNV